MSISSSRPISKIVEVEEVEEVEEGEDLSTSVTVQVLPPSPLPLPPKVRPKSDLLDRTPPRLPVKVWFTIFSWLCKGQPSKLSMSLAK